MNYLVTFDIPIENTRIRTKLGEKCMDYGLFRIQLSVFWGSLEKSELEDLMFECEEIIDNSPADVRFFAICDQCLEKSFVIANNAKIQTIHAKRISENLSLSTLTHIDVGWNLNPEKGTKAAETQNQTPSDTNKSAMQTSAAQTSTPETSAPKSSAPKSSATKTSTAPGKRIKEVEELFDLSDEKTWQQFQSEYLKPSDIGKEINDGLGVRFESEEKENRKEEKVEVGKGKEKESKKEEKIEVGKEEEIEIGKGEEIENGKENKFENTEWEQSLNGKILNLKDELSKSKNLTAHLSQEIIKFLKTGQENEQKSEQKDKLKNEQEPDIENLPVFDREFIEKLIELSQSNIQSQVDNQEVEIQEAVSQIKEFQEKSEKLLHREGESFVSLNDIIKHISLLEKKPKLKAKYHGFIDVDVILV